MAYFCWPKLKALLQTKQGHLPKLCDNSITLSIRLAGFQFEIKQFEPIEALNVFLYGLFPASFSLFSSFVMSNW